MLNNTELDVTLKSNKDAIPVPKLIINSSKITVASTNLNNNSQVPERKKTFFRNEDKYSRLEKYEEIDRQDPLNLPFVPPQGFKGPIVERKSTDRSWILLFLIIYVLYGVYSYFVLTSGNPERLAHGTDFRGEICGIGTLKNKPFLYYAGPVTDINVAWCVRQCPPSTGRETCIYDTDHITVTSFCYIQMQADQMGYYCVPKEPKSRELVFQNLGSFRNIMRRIASDLWQSWDITLVGFGLSIILSYLFTVLAKYQKIASGLIWGAIIFAQAGLVLLAYLFYLESIRAYDFRCIDGMDPNTCGGLIVTVYYYLAFVFLGFAGLYLIVTIILFRRIQRGIELLKTAQHIVQVLSQIRSFPFIIAFAGLVICGLAFILVVFAMTVGSIDLSRAKNIDGHLLYVINYSDTIQFGLIFVAFTVLFTLTLILTMNDMFTSYALSVWFFTKQKDTVRIPYCFSFKTLFKYHFGTCVFVAFNLMFLTIPQSIMDYSRSIMRCLPQTSSCVRYTQASCMACIHSFEVFLRYISKNSVVQVAIWSEPYYQSAKKAYFLIFRNQNKIKDLDFLQTLIVFQIRLATAFMASIPVYMFINFAPLTFLGNETNLIESPIVPTLYVLICGMFFSNVFQGSYDITCKTIIQLYCMDCEMFFGEQRFVEQFIREFMEFVGKIEDNEWKIGFTRQIKFDKEKFNKNLERYNNSDGGSDSPKEYDEDEQQDGDKEGDQVDEDKYSEQYVDYDEKIDRGNAFIGLPTEYKPKTDNTKKPSEELGNASQSLIQQDQTMIQGDQTMALGSNKQLRLKTPILNTSQQSFQILLNSNANDKSQISQVSELDEKPKREKIIKKQRL